MGVARMMNAAAPAVRLQRLTLAYGLRPAVLDVSGEFLPGSLTAIVGPNGAGKSTLLAALAGQLRPVSGRLVGLPGRGGAVAWLPQRPAIDRSFPLRALDLVALGLWRQLGSLRPARDPQHEAIRGALEQVGAADLALRPIAELSMGQLQRLLFARVIVQDASVILLDEPFAALDAGAAEDLMQVIERWHAQRRTIIAVLHDMDLVRARFPATLVLERRCIAWGDTAAVLPYGATLAGRIAAGGRQPDHREAA